MVGNQSEQQHRRRKCDGDTSKESMVVHIDPPEVCGKRGKMRSHGFVGIDERNDDTKYEGHRSEQDCGFKHGKYKQQFRIRSAI